MRARLVPTEGLQHGGGAEDARLDVAALAAEGAQVLHDQLGRLRLARPCKRPRGRTPWRSAPRSARRKPAQGRAGGGHGGRRGAPDSPETRMDWSAPPPWAMAMKEASAMA
eukprot:scaffold165_cov265-Prasinococcus_capsulatus_cf.AAC.5